MLWETSAALDETLDVLEEGDGGWCVRYNSSGVSVRYCHNVCELF